MRTAHFSHKTPLAIVSYTKLNFQERVPMASKDFLNLKTESLLNQKDPAFLEKTNP
jgi:hypothetical protein